MAQLETQTNAFSAIRGARLCAGALIALCWVSPARAQLQNSGFESGDFTGWTTFGNVTAVAPITPHSGSYVAAVAGSNNGDPNYTGFHQSLPASPGQLWETTAFVRQNSGTTLGGTDNTLALKIEFYRSVGGQYGTADFIDEAQLIVLDDASPANVWTQHTLQGVAPAETVEARVAFVFTQVAGAGGAAVIDDVTFTNGDEALPWTLVWQDEFDGPSLDTTKWRAEDIHLIKNNELQYYAPDDVYINTNGTGGESVLVLRSQDRTYWGFDTQGNWRQFDYTSGLVESREHYAAVYGRWEVRAKLPTTRGMWPAHWMLPIQPIWPPEIDIMEAIGTRPYRIHMSHHWGPLPPGTAPWDIGQTVTTEYDGPDYSAGFHTFAIEWRPSEIHWYIDDVLRAASARPEVPSQPMFMTLNTAVGGDWPGSPDGSTIFPQYHEIDYVRVYMPSDPGDALSDLTDVTHAGAVTDGVINPSEYSQTSSGINDGLLGSNAMMHVESDARDHLQLGFTNTAGLPASGSVGVVVYLDVRPGGFDSTYAMRDIADPARRLASGKGSNNQRGDLFFAKGFTADYAICVRPDLLAVYELKSGSHQFINGATLGSATDVYGGHAASYQGNATSRELSLRLSDLGIAQAGTFRMVASVFDTTSGQRDDSFIGVALGNSWDGSSGGNATVLKVGDFLEVTTAPRLGDADADGDIDANDVAVFTDCQCAPDETPSPSAPMTAATCRAAMDWDNDGDVDLRDYARMQSSAP